MMSAESLNCLKAVLEAVEVHIEMTAHMLGMELEQLQWVLPHQKTEPHRTCGF
jgi:3-oxoacyl-[acyl-carrier-protein] synthase III